MSKEESCYSGKTERVATSAEMGSGRKGEKSRRMKKKVLLVMRGREAL